MKCLNIENKVILYLKSLFLRSFPKFQKRGVSFSLYVASLIKTKKKASKEGGRLPLHNKKHPINHWQMTSALRC